MCGFSCSFSAAAVSDGTLSFLVNRTGSLERAAHAAAGSAYSGDSPEATTTSPDGLPFATLENLSTATATAYGLSPLMRAALRPSGGPGLLPTRMAWAPLASWAPFGLGRSSVSEVTGGSESPSVSRIGARSGADTSADAATAPCQSSLSTSTTAGGRVSSDDEGKTALATPAASAVASLPLTRVVLRVAVTGKPSCSVAFLSVDFAPVTGVATGAPPVSSLELSLREQPGSSSAATRTAADRGARSTIGEGSGGVLTGDGGAAGRLRSAQRAAPPGGP